MQYVTTLKAMFDQVGHHKFKVVSIQEVWIQILIFLVMQQIIFWL